jgi:arylformamidase
MNRKVLLLALGIIILLLLIGLIIDTRPWRTTDWGNDRESVDVFLPEEPAELRKDTDDITVTEYSYGKHAREKLDVYTTSYLTNAPVIIMLHGGGWTRGDKANKSVYANKVDFWVPKGYVFISVNTPLLPDQADIATQADALAKAITFVQAEAATWGGDPKKVVVMGHSSGAHIVALVSATIANYPTLAPWQGTVLLDSGALDLVSGMENRPSDIFINAFGTDPSRWPLYSPLALLSRAPSEPTLVVCSSLRAKSHCADAKRYVDKITSLGGQATLYPAALNHADINQKLGLVSDYTNTVHRFITDILDSRL